MIIKMYLLKYTKSSITHQISSTRLSEIVCEVTTEKTSSGFKFRRFLGEVNFEIGLSLVSKNKIIAIINNTV